MDPSIPPEIADRLRELAKVIDEASDERERLIVEAFKEHGASFREIARASGLTHTGVRKMLARLGADDWQSRRPPAP